MRVLGRLVAALVAIVIVLAAAAYLLPREVTVTREIVIAAPPEKIFPHLNSLQQAAEWSPWAGLDPAMKTTYAGPEQGVGNRMEWSSSDSRIGTGSQEIIASVPNQRVETALDFGDMGIATAWQVLKPEASGTLVTWGLLADMGNTPLGRYMGLMMDRWVGADYDKGLSRAEGAGRGRVRRTRPLRRIARQRGTASQRAANAVACGPAGAAGSGGTMEHPRGFANRGELEPGVIASSVYRDGKRITDIAIEDAADWAGKDGHVVWIGLLEPSRELLHRVQREFQLHDLAIEDAEHAHQRPKLEQYGDALFIVARTAQLIDKRVSFGETHLFVGKGYLVSVRHGASTSYTAVRQHWESCPTSLAKGEDFILYAILDFIVDNYMPVLEAIEEEADAIEDKVLVTPMTAADIERLYMLRRDLLRLRNAAGPLVEVCRRLTSTELPQVRPAMHPLFARRHRPHPHRAGEDRQPARGARLRLRGQRADGPEPGDRDLQEARVLGRHPRRPHGARRHLRHELREHARAQSCPFGYYTVIGMIVTICSVLFWRFKKNGWL